MSVDIIQAQYEQLDNIASRFGQEAESNTALAKKIAQAMHSLQNGGWEGKGATAFFAEMETSTNPALQRLIQALEEAQRVTLTVKEIIRAAEEEATIPFQKSNVQVIPANGESSQKGFMEIVHGALDVAGFIPGIGEIADGVNAVIYLTEGRYIEAGISAVAMIPILGDLGKGGKWSVKAAKELAENSSERLIREGAEVVVEKGAKHSDEFLKFGKLTPNSTYARNGYEYATDGLGRTKHVSGELKLETAPRTGHQTEVGSLGLPSDEGGHLIGSRFGGSPEGVNLVPQNVNLNRGAWKRMENTWDNALQAGQKVEVNIEVLYPPGNTSRPSAFSVKYSIDGQPYQRVFKNNPGG